MENTLVVVGCLLTGFLAGVLVPIDFNTNDRVASTSDANPSESKLPQVKAFAGGQDPVNLSEAEQPTDSGNSGAGSARITPPSTVMVSTDLIAQLSVRGSSRNLGQALIDRDGAIEQALQISEQEQAQLQASWESTKQRLRELEVRAATVEEMKDLSVRITLPEMNAQKDLLNDQLRQSMQQTLGQNRSEVFLAAKQLEQVLAASAEKRTYTIVAESPKEGEWRFNMTLESPAGRRVWVGESIPDEIRHLTDAAQISPSISELR